MLTFEEAAVWLDSCMEKLPKEIFKDLNGGVNLLPERREDSDGLLTMGMYITDWCGRRVEIYYGSFEESFAGADDEEIRRELDKTLRHELTHHIENLAGDRSLEKWDEEQREVMLNDFAPLEAKSVLFVAENDASLAPICQELFQKSCREKGLSFRSGSAGIESARKVEPKCAAAAESLGVSIEAHCPRIADGALLEEYEAVLCLNGNTADALAERFPQYREKIMCLGYTDYAPPRLGLKPLWMALGRALCGEVENLIGDMTGDYEDDRDPKRL